MNRPVVMLSLLLVASPAAAQPSEVVTRGWLKAQLRVRLQADVRASEAPLPEGLGAMGQRRIGVKGDFARMFGYEVEYDAGNRRWSDAYVEYRRLRSVRIRAGVFKLPVGLEATTSGAALDFVHRTRLSARLASGRDRGVALRGKIMAGRVVYDAGVFRHDGDNARRTGGSRVFGGPTIAGRLAVEPFRRSESLASTLQLGVSGSRSEVPLGVPAVRGRTALGFSFFNPRVWVAGARLRSAFEAQWSPGRLSVQSEYMRLTDERKGQSVENGDLPPMRAHGWYLSGVYRIARNKSRFGRLEAAARIESLRFGSAGGEGNPSASARAPRILGNGEQGVAVGVNWYPHRWVKVQANLIRERLDDPAQGPLPTRPVFWSRILRLQLAI